VSQHQIGLLASTFDALDLDPAVLSRDRGCPLDQVGGFLALRSPVAAALVRGLHARGVSTDSRGEILRLGPAPYLSDRQLRDAMGLLGEVVRENAAAQSLNPR
jgi:kynureninase